MNFAKIKAIEAKNKQRILEACPSADEDSGIYAFARIENGYRYAYVGQAKHLLSRLAQHLSGYQHIDISLRKRGFYADGNYGGWSIHIYHCLPENLDNQEQTIMLYYADAGYQLYNKTTGSQGEGKRALGEAKSTKGYREGLTNGYEKARKEVAKLFEKNLTVSINGKVTANKQKALEKFQNFVDLGAKTVDNDDDV